jgi:glycosyltransferase involved in cell wall biosynthesis
MSANSEVKVISVVFNTFQNDNRVLRSARVLGEMGFDVTVAALAGDGLQLAGPELGVYVERMAISTSKLPRGKVFGFLKYAERCFRFARRYRKAQVWHCNDFNPFLAAILAKMMNRKLKIVYDCHEYQSEMYGKSAFERKAVRFFESRYIKRADVVITVSTSIAEEYQRLYGLEKVHILMNVPDRSDAPKSNLLREALTIDSSKRLFLYQGKLGADRGVRELVEAFAQHPQPHAVLVVMGNGPLQAEIEAATHSQENIFFHPSVPYQLLLKYTASADFGFVSTQNTSLNNYYCMPNKLFEYIQAGIPVVSNNLKDCAAFVEEMQVGITLKSWTAQAIAKGVKQCMDQPSGAFDRGLERAKNEFVWEKERLKLESIYRNLMAES